MQGIKPLSRKGISHEYTGWNNFFTFVNQITPFDDTAPTSAEGSQVSSLSITPKRSDTLIRVNIFYWACANANVIGTSAIFADAGASSLDTISQPMTTDNFIPFFHEYYHTGHSSGVAITFKCRLGTHANCTYYVNGQTGARKFGGKMYIRNQQFEIEEI